ncbi:MAG: ATP/GTP-binding protein [Candidatus Ornithospirochaeta sp.]
MLLEFRFKNYKSFVDETVFSMVPAPKQTGLDYSVLSQKAGSKERRALCSAVIYGPNASGKTNIIGAMETLKTIVLRGNIRNSDSDITPNIASSSLELIPNCDGNSSPTEISISFVEKELLIEYSLVMDLGCFLSKDYERKILEEKLLVNDKEIFSRGANLEVALPSSIRHLSNKSIKRITPKTKEIAENSLSDTELFLTNGFKNIFAKELVDMITNWFSDKFIVIYRSDAIKVMRKFAAPKDNTIYVETTLTQAAKEFGINSNALGYRSTDEGEDVVLCSIFSNNKVAIPADAFESYGTIRFINEFPLVINALINGGTLAVDEFDASIHPMALMNIISIFHNDEINKNHAQLIFNTHNPIFLDASLFRRDEIKFVERDSETNHSSHYSLSDFKTKDGIRKGEDYMSNYFINRYGAINEIDFSSILKRIITNSEDK